MISQSESVGVSSLPINRICLAYLQGITILITVAVTKSLSSRSAYCQQYQHHKSMTGLGDQQPETFDPIITSVLDYWSKR